MELEKLWTEVAEGKIALVDLVGADPIFVEKIRDQGLVAFASGRYERAAKIFAGLEALEPSQPLHALHLAHAKARGGETEEAIAALSRYLDATPDDLEERVRAHLMRALLVAGSDREKAAQDLFAARELAGEDAGLLALVGEIGGAA